MATNKANKERINARRLISFFQEQFDLQKCIEIHGKNAREIYLEGMGYLSKTLGNAGKKTLLNELDATFLSHLLDKDLTQAEITDMMGVSSRQAQTIGGKLLQLGVIYTSRQIVDKQNKALYCITEYGREELRKFLIELREFQKEEAKNK